MRVVVDTSVWALALRHRNFTPSAHTLLLADVIKDGRASLLGVVRQELLSGMSRKEQFDRLRDQLRSFPDPELEIADYEKAASFSNTCMTNGIQGSLIDFLICAFAARRSYQILTADPDFLHFSAHIPVSLLQP
jgi:predicted nucleic acid-binding protein